MSVIRSNTHECSIYLKFGIWKHQNNIKKYKKLLSAVNISRLAIINGVSGFFIFPNYYITKFSKCTEPRHILVSNRNQNYNHHYN